MEKFNFQLLSCLYLNDSGIPVPVRIRKQSRYTGVRRLALTYRAAGIPASDVTGKFVQSRYTECDATGKFAQSRYTGFRRSKG